MKTIFSIALAFTSFVHAQEKTSEEKIFTAYAKCYEDYSGLYDGLCEGRCNQHPIGEILGESFFVLMDKDAKGFNVYYLADPIAKPVHIKFGDDQLSQKSPGLNYIIQASQSALSRTNKKPIGIHFEKVREDINWVLRKSNDLEMSEAKRPPIFAPPPPQVHPVKIKGEDKVAFTTIINNLKKDLGSMVYAPKYKSPEGEDMKTRCRQEFKYAGLDFDQEFKSASRTLNRTVGR